MKITHHGAGKLTIAVVACLHGDEILGAQALAGINSTECKLIKIVANEEAMNPPKRFLEVDGNRCFPGTLEGRHEERIAAKLVSHLSNVDAVIDIHTTTSKTKPFTIVTKHFDLALHSPLEATVVMSPVVASGRALIDHCRGVSLEFNEKTTVEEVCDVVNKMIYNIVHDKVHVSDKFEVYGKITDKKFSGVNFQLTTVDTESFYPVLLGERSYTDMVCLKARKIN
ncbi:MAG TPA: succinylglutamate desuccinylase/aspartoacylase family protein [Acidobacteriota bacterium]|nr:succinylglutamate desuccinylase/aspartoacylase family protein [Acidobacteriota bacterium]